MDHNKQENPEDPGAMVGVKALKFAEKSGCPADVLDFFSEMLAYADAERAARQAQLDRIEQMLIQITVLEGLEVPGGAAAIRANLN